MIRKIPFKTSVSLLSGILSLIIVFHLVVLAGFVPKDMVWGGKMETREELLRFETISIGINALLLLLIRIRANATPQTPGHRYSRIACGFFAVLFLLNTIGNLFAENSMETIIFPPVTLLLSVLCLRLVWD